MRPYNAGFARLYNLRWGGFVQSLAPKIRELYESTPLGQTNRAALDLCCGTGQLAAILLEAGYTVTGIDLSGPMLAYAKENTRRFWDSGQSRLIQGDAARFALKARFGLAVSTYDALNHLPGRDALKSCFQCVFDVLEPGGTFLFDLNTRFGLRQWNNLSVSDYGDCVLITRGVFDEKANDRAWTQINGFIREAGELYRRVDLTASNAVFDMEDVRGLLLEIGWRDVYFAKRDDLNTPIAEPEQQGRVFFVAKK